MIIWNRSYKRDDKKDLEVRFEINLLLIIFFLYLRSPICEITL